MRVVIDPNVWISALINPYGPPARVVELVMTGAVVTVVTEPLLDELTDVLARPKLRRWISTADATTFLQALAVSADVRPDPGPPTRHVRDPDDDYLVAIAEETGATLVTGDADLLDAYLSPRAVTPRALLEQFDS